MFESILDIFRKRKIRRFISDVPTGFLPLDKISTVNVVIDVEKPGFDLVDNGNFPIEFLSKCAKARFKIGRCGFEGHAYDMVMVGNPTEDLRSDSRQIFSAITEFMTKIR